MHEFCCAHIVYACRCAVCVFCLLRLPLSNERRCGNGQGLSWHTPGLKGPQEDEGGDGLHKANSDYLASGSSQAHRHSSCTELESVAANDIYLLHETVYQHWSTSHINPITINTHQNNLKIFHSISPCRMDQILSSFTKHSSQH